MSLDALRGFDMFWIIGGAAIFRRLRKSSQVRQPTVSSHNSSTSLARVALL